jgi:arginase
VHFDVDVIDFTDAPLSENTGRNVGLTLDQAFAALGVFLGSDRIAALTITELNPDHGEPNKATLIAFVERLVGAFGTTG